MKYSIFLFLFFINSCWGQYPILKISDSGKVYNGNGQTKTVRIIKDSGSYWFTKPGNDTIFFISKTYIKDTIIYPQDETNDKDWSTLQTTFDSSKYYKSKQIYWEKKMKKESKRLDRLKTPQLSQELLDYQDSSIHYKLLLEKYIK